MTTISDIPVAYAYIQFCMGSLIDETGWENTDYIFIAEEAWRILELTSEPTDTTEKNKYKVVLKYAALDQFRRELSTAYDYSADGESFHRSQMFKQVGEMLKEAKVEAMPYLSIGQVEQGRVSYPDDPYSIDGQVEHTA